MLYLLKSLGLRCLAAAVQQGALAPVVMKALHFSTRSLMCVYCQTALRCIFPPQHQATAVVSFKPLTGILYNWLLSSRMFIFMSPRRHTFYPDKVVKFNKTLVKYDMALTVPAARPRYVARCGAVPPGGCHSQCLRLLLCGVHAAPALSSAPAHQML